MKSRSTNELPSAICSENGPFDVTHRQNFWRSANVREGWLADTLEKRIPRPLRSEENLPLWLSRLLINNSSPRSTINEMDNKWTRLERERLLSLQRRGWKTIRRSLSKGNLPTYDMKGSIEIEEPLRAHFVLLASGWRPFSAYEIRWTNAKTSRMGKSRPTSCYYRRREYTSREFRIREKRIFREPFLPLIK